MLGLPFLNNDEFYLYDRMWQKSYAARKCSCFICNGVINKGEPIWTTKIDEKYKRICNSVHQITVTIGKPGE